MKLHSVRIRNFRALQDETIILFDDLTALIGRNEAGKSTILEALDIFLNDINPDKEDASKGGDGSDLTIVCQFSELPDSVILDKDNATSLGAEHLLNGDNRLEIHKTFSGHSANPKITSTSAYAVHPGFRPIKWTDG